MTQKIIKTGNSAAVTIPVEFFDSLCLRYGDPAEATLDSEKGTITYRFPNGRQLSLTASEAAGKNSEEEPRPGKSSPDRSGEVGESDGIDDQSDIEGKENDK